MKTYQDVKIPEEESDVLAAISITINQDIPLIESVEWGNFGFSFSDNHITGLALCDKEIKSIPNSIGHLSELKFLSLPKNQLEQLPISIGDLEHLEYLYLDYNSLKELLIQ